MTPWDHLKSAISLAFITAQLSFWAIGLVVLGVAKRLVPALRPGVDRAMDAMYRTAVVIDDAWLEGVLGIRWKRPALGLSRDRTYVVVSNHVSWSDIFLLQSVLVREGPLLKFLTKRELIWIPIFGVIFWAFDFPMLRRRTRAGEDDAARRRGDVEALREACRIVRERPAALMNFAEGTRFTPEKRAASASPYRHLLRPRVGGLAALLEALDEDFEAVLDVTLVYPREVSFWRFLSGALPRVEVDVERLPREEVPRERDALSDWLAARWARKDARIALERAASGHADEAPSRP